MYANYISCIHHINSYMNDTCFRCFTNIYYNFSNCISLTNHVCKISEVIHPYSFIAKEFGRLSGSPTIESENSEWQLSKQSGPQVIIRVI